MACDIIRQSFKTLLMQRFINFLQEGNGDSLFLAIAKTTPWANETDPPESVDSIEQETDFWRECIAMKKIKTDDVALVIPRYDWALGTIFDTYQDDADLFDENGLKKFYVLVDDKRIYKVIDNNDGATSTVKPQETSTNIFKTADGYSWKFIYEIAEGDSKFLTSKYIPIFTVSQIKDINDPRKNQLDVQNAATDGSIDFIDVVDAGTVYSQIIDGVSAGTHIISATSATAKEYVLAGPSLSHTDGVYFNYSLKMNDPDSSNYGEVRKIVSYIGASRAVKLDTDFTTIDTGNLIGHDFTIIPSIGITGDGTGADAEAKMTNAGNIETVDIISGGSSYTYSELSVFGGNTSATDTILNGIISPAGGHGSDAIEEFGSASLMISLNLDQTEDGLIRGNSDFRQFAVIANPTIGATVVGSDDDVIHSYFVTSPSAINDFDGLSTNGSAKLIGGTSGNGGSFNEYVATLADSQSGVLKIANPTNKFDVGDRVVQASSDFTSGVLSPVSIDRFLTEEFVVDKDVYRQTTRIDVVKVVSDFTLSTFLEDLTVRGSSSGATAVVSSWNPEFITGVGYSTTDGTLDVVKVVGAFNTEDVLSQIGANGVETLSVASITTLNTPEIDYHSGDMLYLENIQVLERDVDQREEIRLILSI